MHNANSVMEKILLYFFIFKELDKIVLYFIILLYKVFKNIYCLD